MDVLAIQTPSIGEDAHDNEIEQTSCGSRGQELLIVPGLLRIVGSEVEEQGAILESQQVLGPAYGVGTVKGQQTDSVGLGARHLTPPERDQGFQ